MKKVVLSIITGVSLLSAYNNVVSPLPIANTQTPHTNYPIPTNNRGIQTSPAANVPNPSVNDGGIIQNSPNLPKSNIITISGTGEGVARPDAISPAQARALARIAAIAYAYKNLAEKMYGIRLSAKDRIKDLVAQRTEVRTAVYGIIKGARIDEESWKDGLYTVKLVVDLNACIWSKYLTSKSFYQCGN